MKTRLVRLLGYDAPVRIDPSDYRRAFDGASAKDFDDTTTRVLRVLRNVKHGTYLVYGMRAENGETVAEIYAVAPAPETIGEVVSRVAEHCGVEPLIEQLSLP